MCFRTTILSMLFLAVALFASELADPEILPDAAKNYDFKQDVQEVLETRCVRCHNAKKPKGELQLDTLANATAGGEAFAGRAIVPGKSAESSIIHLTSRLVADMDMPPEDEGESLTRAEVAKLRAWIDAGAPWPKGLELKARKPQAAAAPETK